MIFSSLTFFAFYGILAIGYAVFKTDLARRRLLLLGSYVFYGWWDPRFLLLMFGSSLWSWWWGNRVASTEDPGLRKRYVWIGVLGDLGVLSFFKYADFFVQSAVDVLGLERAGSLGIILPVGISFFTFQTMSYTIDLYRRRIEPCRDFERFLLFVSFFPQLVAGPIVRASTFLPQLAGRITTDAPRVITGLQLFALGLLQKVVIADNLATVVDPIYATPALYDRATLWLGLGAYGLQIFCDFAGYSLMAIGIARTLGFDLPENFRTPYLSRSITEFWRRWHISLSTWLRDYLYISLGGNRRGSLRTDINLLITMLLGGLWHGAGWNFVIWGGAHGIALLVHKRWTRLLGDRRPTGLLYSLVMWAVTLLFVLLLWVPFRCADFATTMVYLKGLLLPGGTIHWLHPLSLWLIGGTALWHLASLWPERMRTVLPNPNPLAWRPLWAMTVVLLLIALLAPFQASPFIYFQF